MTLQLRETWEYGEQAPRFLLFDRDPKFGADVASIVKTMGSQPLHTALRSPWQNGVAERWVGSVRRDLLDHVIGSMSGCGSPKPKRGARSLTAREDPRHGKDFAQQVLIAAHQPGLFENPAEGSTYRVQT